KDMAVHTPICMYGLASIARSHCLCAVLRVSVQIGGGTMSLRLERIILMSEEFNRIPHRTRQEICEKFEIAERTFFDDLNFIRNFLGLEIKKNRIPGRYYNADPSKKLPVFELSEGEVFALTLGKEMLSEYVGTSFEPILRSAIEKIMRRLPHRVQMDV